MVGWRFARRHLFGSEMRTCVSAFASRAHASREGPFAFSHSRICCVRGAVTPVSRVTQSCAPPTQDGARLGDVDVGLLERFVLLDAPSRADGHGDSLLARAREDHATAAQEALPFPWARARSRVGGRGREALLSLAQRAERGGVVRLAKELEPLEDAAPRTAMGIESPGAWASCARGRARVPLEEPARASHQPGRAVHRPDRIRRPRIIPRLDPSREAPALASREHEGRGQDAGGAPCSGPRIAHVEGTSHRELRRVLALLRG